jgi:hypothetical protein
VGTDPRTVLQTNERVLPMNAFIFASNKDKDGFNAKGQPLRDATYVFMPCAESFRKLHKIPQKIFYFDHHDPNRQLRDDIWHGLLSVNCNDPDGLDAVAYFGHGFMHGLSSVGFIDGSGKGGSQDYVETLAMAISAVSKDDVRVILYACQTGRRGDAFAGRLVRALHCRHARVFAHERIPGPGTGDGHSTANPYVTVWEKNQPGRWLIEPGTKHWRAWTRHMRHAKEDGCRPREENPLWAYFPFMSEEDLKDVLSEPAPAGYRW